MSEDNYITIDSSDTDDVQVMDTAPPPKVVKLENEVTKKRVEFKSVPNSKSTFVKFIEKFKETAQEPSEDTDRAIKKLWKGFNESDPSFTASQLFQNIMDKAMKNVSKEPWSEIKRIYDELKYYSIKKKSKDSRPENSCYSNVVKKLLKESEPGRSSAVANPNEDCPTPDRKTEAHIKKLTKTMAKINSKILYLEKKEVDLNSSDEENSPYIQVSRYKERLCQIFNKISELRSRAGVDNRFRTIKFSGTRIPAVNRAIERFYNVRKQFPDFRDVLSVIEAVNEKKKLNCSASEIQRIAERAFQELGETLKLQRQYDNHEAIISYLPENAVDPAAEDAELKQQLDENKRLYGNRIDEIIDKYASKQVEERLEPDAVPSDAEASENEDDEEEASSADNVTSLSEYETDEEPAGVVYDCNDVPAKFQCRVIISDVRTSSSWSQYGRPVSPCRSVAASTSRDEPCCSKSLLVESMKNAKRSCPSDTDSDESFESKRTKRAYYDSDRKSRTVARRVPSEEKMHSLPGHGAAAVIDVDCSPTKCKTGSASRSSSASSNDSVPETKASELSANTNWSPRDYAERQPSGMQTPKPTWAGRGSPARKTPNTSTSTSSLANAKDSDGAVPAKSPTAVKTPESISSSAKQPDRDTSLSSSKIPKRVSAANQWLTPMGASTPTDKTSKPAAPGAAQPVDEIRTLKSANSKTRPSFSDADPTRVACSKPNGRDSESREPKTANEIVNCFPSDQMRCAAEDNCIEEIEEIVVSLKDANVAFDDADEYLGPTEDVRTTSRLSAESDDCKCSSSLFVNVSGASNGSQRTAFSDPEKTSADAVTRDYREETPAEVSEKCSVGKDRVAANANEQGKRSSSLNKYAVISDGSSKIAGRVVDTVADGEVPNDDDDKSSTSSKTEQAIAATTEAASVVDDEVMIIDEMPSSIRPPAAATKVSTSVDEVIDVEKTDEAKRMKLDDEIIDVEKLADKPSRPRVALPSVNITEFVRKMNFQPLTSVKPAPPRPPYSNAANTTSLARRNPPPLTASFTNARGGASGSKYPTSIVPVSMPKYRPSNAVTMVTSTPKYQSAGAGFLVGSTPKSQQNHAALPAHSTPQNAFNQGRGARLDMRRTLRPMFNNNWQRSTMPMTSQQQQQFSAATQKRTTHTNEVKYVQRNQVIMAKRTTTVVEESVMRMSSQSAVSGHASAGMQAGVRVQNARTVIQGIRSGTREHVQQTQSLRRQRGLRTFSNDDVITLD